MFETKTKTGRYGPYLPRVRKKETHLNEIDKEHDDKVLNCEPKLQGEEPTTVVKTASANDNE